MAQDMQIGMPAISDEEEGTVSTTPVNVTGLKAPRKMKTPGMGKMLGGPNYMGMPSAGAIKPMKYGSGGGVGSASKRADGIAKRGKTKGRVL